MLNYTQYPEAKTNQCSIRNNTQYPEPKSQNPIPPQYLVYQTPNATRDTLRDNTQHQIHQVKTKINLKLYSMPPLGSPVSNSVIHYHNSEKINVENQSTQHAQRWSAHQEVVDWPHLEEMRAPQTAALSIGTNLGCIQSFDGHEEVANLCHFG